MKKIYIFHWDALLEEKVMLLHACLLHAFEHVASPKVQTWSIEDSKQLLGKCSGLIFRLGEKGLWRDKKEASIAKEAFYWWRDSMPVTKLRPEAERMLKVLSNRNERFFIVTAEYKHLMFREVANCWGAAHAWGFAGSVPGKEFQDVSKAIADVKKLAEDLGKVVLVAKKSEEAIATKFGWDFIEATSDNFVMLSN